VAGHTHSVHSLGPSTSDQEVFLFPLVQLKYYNFSNGTFSRNNNKKERKTKVENSKLTGPE
jgi:hypothetical protein